MPPKVRQIGFNPPVRAASDSVVQRDEEYRGQVLVVGDSGVGKSCLILRYVDDCYTEHYISTLGQAHKFKTLELAGKKITLTIIDAQAPRSPELENGVSFRGVPAILICCDLTDRESFNNIKTEWFLKVQRHSSEGTMVFLAGNKSDQINKQEVTAKELAQLAEELNVCGVAITSAKCSMAVEETFTAIAENILTRRLLKSDKHPHAELITQIEARIKTLTQEKSGAFFERTMKLKEKQVEGLNELLCLLRFDLQTTPEEHLRHIKINFPNIEASFSRDMQLLLGSEPDPSSCVIS